MSKIIPIKALKDNYIWMLREDPLSNTVWVVDPGEAQPVIDKLRDAKWQLTGILLTHHHADHSGGIDDLLQYAGKIPVYGSSKSPIASVTHPVDDADTFYCGPQHFTVISIPGHTHDHVAYYSDNALFCGDTLFSAACGRIFEGTAEQMYASLNKLLQLKDTTEIYCGHEYTFKNLHFALHVDPNNPFLQEKMALVELIHASNGCTLPAVLQEEKLINPFLRCDKPEIIKAVENYCGKIITSPSIAFSCLRKWKDNF